MSPKERRSLWPAIWVSLAGHLVLLAILLLLPTPEAEGPPGIAVFTVARPPSTAAEPTGSSGPATGGGSGHPAASAGSPQPAGSPSAGGLAAGAPSLLEEIEEHFRKETFAPPAPGATPGARRDSPVYGEETDSIDGIPHLGSGEPGDPRIPGSGGVDIAKVLRRDAVVAQAQCRAASGQVHPFLGEAKARIEDHWLPVAADVSALPSDRGTHIVPDTGCPYTRYRVGRILAVYDAQGNPLSLTVVDAPSERNIADRLRQAVEKAGMPPPPPELLDDKHLLRLAWNVYIDDTPKSLGCMMAGRGANHDKPGGDYVIGIVELDGVY